MDNTNNTAMAAAQNGETLENIEVKVDDGENTKKAKISKAQQYMFFAVLGASLVAGIAGVVAVYLVRYINFNMRVIAAKDEAIVAYSDAIRNSGACKKPAGTVYGMDELERCNPDDIEAESVPGTLRNAVLVGMTANKDLESVARESVAICKDKEGESYTYAKLREQYEAAETIEQREYYLGLIKMCSSLRVIPDALPSVGNETALMSSLSQIFKMSNWEWESLTPSNSSTATSIPGVNAISLSLSVEGDSATTRNVLSNIEKSIRNFTINTANIVWTENNLTLNAQATAYYADAQELQEKTVTVKPEENKK